MSEERNAVLMLAQMAAIAGCTIQQKPKKICPKPIKQGNLNKICSGCGHKNKKCNCSVEELTGEKGE